MCSNRLNELMYYTISFAYTAQPPRRYRKATIHRMHSILLTSPQCLIHSRIRKFAQTLELPLTLRLDYQFGSTNWLARKTPCDKYIVPSSPSVATRPAFQHHSKKLGLALSGLLLCYMSARGILIGAVAIFARR